MNTPSCCILFAESNGLAHDLDCRAPLNGETWGLRADRRRDWLASELKRQFPNAPIETGPVDTRATDIMVRSAKTGFERQAGSHGWCRMGSKAFNRKVPDDAMITCPECGRTIKLRHNRHRSWSYPEHYAAKEGARYRQP